MCSLLADRHRRTHHSAVAGPGVDFKLSSEHFRTLAPAHKTEASVALCFVRPFGMKRASVVRDLQMQIVAVLQQLQRRPELERAGF